MSWLGTWAKRRELAIDYTKVKTTLTNFPVLIRLTTASGKTSKDLTSLFTELGANNKKLAIATSDGLTECKAEIVRWNNAENQAWLYAKIPSISALADTKLYLYYDSAQPDNDTNIGVIGSEPGIAVWSQDYVCVLHLTEQGDGTADEYKDSTGRGNHGKGDTEFPDREANSKFGYAQHFGGYGTHDKVIVDDSADLSQVTTNYLTMSMWLNYDENDIPYESTSHNYARILTKGDAMDNLEYHIKHWAAYVGNPGATSFYVFKANQSLGAAATVSGSTRQQEGEWWMMTATLDYSDLTESYPNLCNRYNDFMHATTSNKYPDDGYIKRSVPYNNINDDYDVYPQIDGDSDLYIGGGATTPYNDYDELDGYIAEFRMRNVKSTDAWIIADYNSQNDSLVTFGDEESYSGGGFTLPPNAISVNKSKLPLLMGM